MGAERKWEVIDLVRRSPLSQACTLEELGIPLLLAVPSADQRQAGAVPRDAQGSAESAGVHHS
jgi:hypothetical protein